MSLFDICVKKYILRSNSLSKLDREVDGIINKQNKTFYTRENVLCYSEYFSVTDKESGERFLLIGMPYVDDKANLYCCKISECQGESGRSEKGKMNAKENTKNTENDLLQISLKRGEIINYKASSFTDYMIEDNLFIVIRGTQWIGMYNMDCVEYVAYIKEDQVEQ